MASIRDGERYWEWLQEQRDREDEERRDRKDEEETEE